MASNIKVFFSYAHEDEDFRRKIEKCLEILRRQDCIEIWHDRVINPGIEWEKEIEYHLNTANSILLLVSRDFIASEYCYSVQVKRAMERHEAGEARVIPIILRPTHWQLTPFGKLQALPTDGLPIIDPKWESIDYALFDIEEGLRKVIGEYNSPDLDILVPKDVYESSGLIREFNSPHLPTGSWPSPEEYDVAIKEYVTITLEKNTESKPFFEDKYLLNPGGVMYARVYKIENLVLRCFTTSAPPDIRERYLAINAYLEQFLAKLPFLVPHKWVDQGIVIDHETWPIVTAPYIERSLQLAACRRERSSDQVSHSVSSCVVPGTE